MEIEGIEVFKHHATKLIIEITDNKQKPRVDEYNNLKTIQNLRSKLRNKNTLQVKANKGNPIALMDKTDYINKIVKYLQKNSQKENPTNKFQRKII